MSESEKSNVKRCRYCKADNADEQVFCTQCGGLLSTSAAPVTGGSAAWEYSLPVSRMPSGGNPLALGTLTLKGGVGIGFKLLTGGQTELPLSRIYRLELQCKKLRALTPRLIVTQVNGQETIYSFAPPLSQEAEKRILEMKNALA